MIDINLIREKPEIVRENMKKKFRKDLEIVDVVLKLDDKWKKIKFKEEQLRGKRNKISVEINKLKKSGKEKKYKELIKQAKKIPDEILKLGNKRKKINHTINELLLKIPNIISENVPIGRDDSQNISEEFYGEKTKFDFPVKGHMEIAENLGLADFESSATVSGNGFYYLQGELALLNQALIRYGIEKMISKGFVYVETPLILKEEIIDKVTDIADKQQQIYTLKDEKLALIGTSEHSLIGRYAGKEIDEKKLPIKQTSYSMCFRKEIGSHGIDEKGLFRTHQFNKIEMIVICNPEESKKFYNELKNISIEIFRDLEIPIRVLKICSGDLGDLKYEQVDIEAYSPRKDKYIEVGSCSNLTDAQARKLGITTRIKNKRTHPHTLNNTAIATSRVLVAIIENNQQKDGSIKIPKVLQKYLSGREKIEKAKN